MCKQLQLSNSFSKIVQACKQRAIIYRRLYIIAGTPYAYSVELIEELPRTSGHDGQPIRKAYDLSQYFLVA